MTGQKTMTRRSARVRPPAPLRDAAEGSPGGEPEPPTGQCTRCGGLGTHYLTCPGLRLPAGYRLSADSRPQPSRPADSCLLCG
jgi:hypothetical protein